MTTGEWIRHLRHGLIAVAAALGQLGVALSPEGAAGTAVTGAEWVQVALAGLAAAGIVAAGTDRPRPGSGPKDDESH